MMIWELLMRLEQKGPPDISVGICYNIREIVKFDERMLADWRKYRKACFADWYEFSGDGIYPVPGFAGRSAENSFDYADALNMWNPNHPYGASRLRLLDHCIKWFKERDI